MVRPLAVFALVLLLAVPAWAHVESPDVFFDGWAGPYHQMAADERSSAVIKRTAP